jgi:hypothetical protein
MADNQERILNWDALDTGNRKLRASLRLVTPNSGLDSTLSRLMPCETRSTPRGDSVARNLRVCRNLTSPCVLE